MSQRLFQALPGRELLLGKLTPESTECRLLSKDPKDVRPLADQAPHSLLKSTTC